MSVALARSTGNQVESKAVRLVEILRKCGSVKHLKAAFKKIRDVCTPGMICMLHLWSLRIQITESLGPAVAEKES